MHRKDLNFAIYYAFRISFMVTHVVKKIVKQLKQCEYLYVLVFYKIVRIKLIKVVFKQSSCKRCLLNTVQFYKLEISK